MKKLRELNGVLLLDKPPGLTSNSALQRVKRLFNAKHIKVGHTGSLDPLATGMLPICFGEATKFSGFLLNADKKYLVTMQLGVKTDTGDLDGSIIATDDNSKTYDFTELHINKVLTGFLGEISQIPPIYSAIKQNGVPLYKIARIAKKKSETINITPLPRMIKIYNIKLLNICHVKQQISLEVYCSKGTYIRSLVEDIAVQLNCLATVATLRRTVVGNFLPENMVTVAELANYSTNLEQILLPVEICLANLPVLKINQIDAVLLQQGKRVYLDDLELKFGCNSLICLINYSNNELLGVGEVIENNILVAKRLVRFN